VPQGGNVLPCALGPVPVRVTRRQCRGSRAMRLAALPVRRVCARQGGARGRARAQKPVTEVGVAERKGRVTLPYPDARQGAYHDALEELALAEEAWALAPPDVLALVDNPGLLQLDTVWCARAHARPRTRPDAGGHGSCIGRAWPRSGTHFYG